MNRDGIWAVLWVAVLVFQSSCFRGASRSETVRALVVAGKNPIKVDSTLGIADAGIETRVRPQGGNIECRWEDWSGESGLDEVVTLDPNAGSVWAGNLVTSEGLATGGLNDVRVARTPGLLTLVSGPTLTAVEAGRFSYSEILIAPSVESSTDARHSIVSRMNSASVPSNLGLRFATGQSSNEAFVKARINVEFLGQTAKTFASAAVSENETTFVAQFSQVFYVINFTPQGYYSPTALLLDGVEESTLRARLERGNSLLYVSDVKYGKSLLLVGRTTASETDLQAALSAAVSLGVKVDTDLEASKKDVLTRTTVNFLARGGVAATGVVVAEKALDGKGNMLAAVRSFIAAPITQTELEAALPVAYSLKDVATNITVQVANPTKYRRISCVDRCDAESHGFSVNGGGSGFRQFSAVHTYSACQDQRPAGNLRLLVHTGGTWDWAHLTIEQERGRWFGEANCAKNATCEYSIPLNGEVAGRDLKFQLWTPGFLGIPGSGGGDLHIQAPSFGDATVEVWVK